MTNANTNHTVAQSLTAAPVPAREANQMDSTSNGRVSIAWSQALTLQERIALSGSVIDFDEQRGERRLQRWMQQNGFNDDQRFYDRLAADGITRAEFVQLLGETAESLGQRAAAAETPDWQQELMTAYDRPQQGESPLPAIVAAEAERQQFQFLYLIEPLIQSACQRFRQQANEIVERFPQAPFNVATVEQLVVPKWCEAIVHLLDQTLVLELNVARLEERLTGDTPAARFASFISLLQNRQQASRLLEEYPVLARQVVVHLTKSVNFAIEFLTHLAADLPQVQNEITGHELGQLIDLEMNAGDTHCDGKSVMICKFESGTKLVYKPRSLSIDIHFQALLQWLNEHGDHPEFRTLNVVDKTTRGWVEFVTPADCEDRAAVKRFYERQGAFLGLLYAIGATDFHFENIMASGEHPVLLDLESLFHPRKEMKTLDEGPDQLAHDTILDSVLGIGLLPQKLFLGEDNQGIDISGMGATENQMSPDLLPYWEGVGSDEMRLERRRMAFEAGNHRPTLDGVPVRPIDYVDQVVAGFRDMYRLLREQRGDLLATDGPFAPFRNDQVRVILRHTRSYGLIVQESSHPDLLRDALDRDRLYDHLWRDVDDNPKLPRAMEAERRDLQNGDIPFFTTQPGSRDVWTSDGRRLDQFLADEDTISVHGRIPELTPGDQARQEWFVRASFASTVSYRDVPSETYTLNEPTTRYADNEYLQAAIGIGERLESLAVHNDREAVWLGLTLVDETTWSLVSSGLDLYSGLPGISLFLAYLGQASGQERFIDLAEEATRSMQRHIERTRHMASTVGGYTGWGGVIYSLTHLGEVLSRRDLTEQAIDLAEMAGKFVEIDQTFDIIDGSAGCLGSLLSLYEIEPSERVLKTAIKCGEWLVDHAQPMGRGVAWQPRAAEQHPLAGYSHGAAGVAWGLLKLAAITNNDRFRQTALQAIEFERGLFSADHNNWPDRRIDPSDPETQNDSPKFMSAWCNGAPGIGLARLDTLSLLDNAEIRSEIATAVKTTSVSGFGDNHSLCHGDLGNLELLLRAGEVLPELADDRCHRLAAGILESGQSRGWYCGVPMHTETPGLMTGLSGIGYGLLRLAKPEQTPSVLTMAAPIRR